MTIEEDDDVIKTIASADGEQNDETPRSQSKKESSMHSSPEIDSVAPHGQMSEKNNVESNCITENNYANQIRLTSENNVEPPHGATSENNDVGQHRATSENDVEPHGATAEINNVEQRGATSENNDVEPPHGATSENNHVGPHGAT
jgi:hypothetical protein